MKKHNKNPNYIVYGRHACLAVLQNPKRPIHEIYLLENSEYKDQIPKQYAKSVQIVSPKTLDKICREEDKHQGIALCTSDAIEDLSLNDYISIIQKKPKASVVILDQVNDPHNIGAIIRSAKCFGVDLLILPKYSSPSINGSVIRSSVGMSEYLNISIEVNLNNSIKSLKDKGFKIFAMDITNNIDSIHNISKYTGDYNCIILGSEGKGIRPSLLENSDYIIKIPISHDCDSLNVSNSAAIAMYELNKIQK